MFTQRIIIIKISKLGSINYLKQNLHLARKKSTKTQLKNKFKATKLVNFSKQNMKALPEHEKIRTCARKE